jgi:hypothetical protein
MATTTPEATSILISLIPVVVGGFIALLGAVGGGLLSHWLKTKSEKASRRAEKFEELLVAVFDHKHWLAGMNSHRVFGGEEPDSMSPVAKIRAITSLYFPEFKENVSALDIAADKYELSMFDAGLERLKSGCLSEETLSAVKAAYAPYLQAFHELVKALEAHGKALSR